MVVFGRYSAAMAGLLVAVLMLTSPAPVSAAADCNSRGFLGLPNWYKYLPGADSCDPQAYRTQSGQSISGQEEMNFGLTIGAVLLAVFEILLYFAGIAGVGAVIYGGIQYILSQGMPDKTSGAIKTILNGLIGLAIAILSIAIVNLAARVFMGS
jgi:hypothetical protein